MISVFKYFLERYLTPIIIPGPKDLQGTSPCLPLPPKGMFTGTAAARRRKRLPPRTRSAVRAGRSKASCAPEVHYGTHWHRSTRHGFIGNSEAPK